MSSGFSYPNPIFSSPIYNPAFYLSLDASGYLTYDYAQTLYLDKNDYRLTYITGITPGTATQGVAVVPGTNNDIGGVGAFSCSSLTVGGSAVVSSPDYVLSITPGLAAASKALVLDGNRDITNINSLTATTLTGTLQTGAQTNITAIGTLTSLSLNGNLTFSGAGRTITGLSSISATTITGAVSGSQTGITAIGTLSALTISGNLTFSGAGRTITGLSSISATTLTGAVSGSQTGITSVGTLTNLTLSTGGTGLFIPNLKFYNSTTTLYDNFNHSYYVGVSEGGCVAQKALVVDLNKDIGSIRNLNAVSVNGSTQVSGALGDFGEIAGTLQTADQPNITTLGTLTGLTVNGNLTMGGISPNITGLTQIDSTFYRQNGTLYDISLTGLLNVSAGTAATSKALVLDSSRNIVNINSLTSSALSAGDTTGDGTLNALNSTGNASMRFGTALTGKNCYTMSWIYDGAASNSNHIEYNTYGTSGTLSLFANDTVVIGSTSTRTSRFSVIGNGTNLYGSWKRTLRLQNDNATPLVYEIIIYNENGGSNTNGVACGTMTNDPINWMINGSTCMLLNTSKRLAVDRTSPEATIHSGGAIWADDAFHCKGNASAAYYRWNWGLSNYPAIGNDATSGSMRIGICNASYAWQSYLPIRAGAYTNASDRRIKRDIIDIPYGLADVMRMQPRRFAIRSEGSLHVGFIAQEMLDIVPESVSGVESIDDEMNDQNEPCNPMGIDLASLTSVLCKAIQELKTEVDELRAIISNEI